MASEEPILLSKIIVSNIAGSTTEDELVAFFGLRATLFLQKYCSVNYNVANRSARVTAPAPVAEEIAKLDGHVYKGEALNISAPEGNDVDDIINDNFVIDNRNYDNVDNNINDPIDSIIIVNIALDNNDDENNYFINGKDVICAFAFLICDVNLDSLSRSNEIISKFRLGSKPGL